MDFAFFQFSAWEIDYSEVELSYFWNHIYIFLFIFQYFSMKLRNTSGAPLSHSPCLRRRLKHRRERLVWTRPACWRRSLRLVSHSNHNWDACRRRNVFDCWVRMFYRGRNMDRGSIFFISLCEMNLRCYLSCSANSSSGSLSNGLRSSLSTI